MVLSVVMAEENQTGVLEVAVQLHTEVAAEEATPEVAGGCGLTLVVPTGAMVEAAVDHTTPEPIKITLPV